MASSKRTYDVTFDDTGVCDGHGECWLTDYDANVFDQEAWEKDPNITCRSRCRLLVCTNHAVCKQEMPAWLYLMNDGICRYCKQTFRGHNPLTISPRKGDCPICLESKLMVKHLFCSHTTCVDCFKRTQFEPADMYEEEPEFPFSEEIQERYLRDPDGDWWVNNAEYQEWEAEWEAWSENVELEEENYASNKRCCICRV